MHDIEILEVSGKGLKAFAYAVANLRIRVFREYPYLYESSEAYELEYLQPYMKSDEAVFFLVKDGGGIYLYCYD